MNLYATEIWQKLIIVVISIVAFIGYQVMFDKKASKLKKWKPSNFAMNKIVSLFVIILSGVSGVFMQTPFLILGVMYLFAYATLFFINDNTLINGYDSDGNKVRHSGRGGSSFSSGGSSFSHSFGRGHSSGGGASR